MLGGSEHNDENEHPKLIPPFHARFGIEVDLESAKQHFVNRVLNEIDSKLNGLARHHDYPYRYNKEIEYVASVLGVEAFGASPLIVYSGEDFVRLLICLEALYEALGKYKSFSSPWERENLDTIIKWALSISEVDLGIQWENGIFQPSGAKLLDEELVSEPMKWLADPKYKNVLEPFQKGRRHHMEASRDQRKLSDTITDMYEALEATARIVNGNNSNLKANTELFVSNLQLSPDYSKMLKDYCEYANRYRHAAKRGEQRIPPKHNEVEAFVYTTGLFIRLAIQQLAEK